MKKLHLLGAVCACLFLFNSSSWGSTVHYDESIDGELGPASEGEDIDMGLFDLGINTVTGSGSWISPNTWENFDHDDFSFIVGNDHALKSVTYEYTLISTLTDLLHDRRIFSGIAGSSDETFVVGNSTRPADPSPNSLHENILPLYAGTYRYRNTGGVNSNIDPWDTYWNWTLSFEIVEASSIEPPAVPIPPSVWLFGSGLIGLIGVSKRKKVA